MRRAALEQLAARHRPGDLFPEPLGPRLVDEPAAHLKARLAILGSYAAMGVTFLVGLVGIALFMLIGIITLFLQATTMAPVIRRSGAQ